MNKMKRILLALSVVTLLLTMTIPAFAYVPFNTYNYDFYGDTIASPSGYVPEAIYLSEDLGISSIHSPNDIFVYDVKGDDGTDDGYLNDNIYLLDLGADYSRGRLCVFDANFKLIKEYRSLIDTNGAEYYLKNPCGVTVKEEYDDVAKVTYTYAYICDTDNGAVLKVQVAVNGNFDLALENNGKIILKYEQPGDDVFDASYTYQPYKIVVGINGSAYVISKGCLDGILEFNTKGEFVRFFGAPKVQLGVNDYFEIYWRSIYRNFSNDSEEVDDKFVTFVPTEFENMDIDDKGFIFTTVIANEKSSNEVSKLNFTGTNVLSPTTKSTKKVSDALSTNYGDLKIRGTDIDNNFVDVVVDEDGFFSLLDTKLCKVFEYDSEGNLIFVYGGDGQQVGTLEKATAMAKLGKKTLVIDATTCSITVFKLSDYGEALHEAVVLYNLGLYTQAEEPWNEVLLYNANSDIAHVGIGKLYYMNAQYEEAMNEFKLANDRENYSRSFALYRKELIRENFALGASAIVVLLILVIVLRKVFIVIKKKKAEKGGAVNG